MNLSNVSSERMSIMSYIEVRELQKSYDYYEKEQGLRNSFKNILHRQKMVKEAVKGISFQIDKGEMIGMIGPNGAGKTTTMKMLSGILYPTGGEALVDGYTPWERNKQYKLNMSIVMGQKSQLNWDLPAIESFYLNKCIYEIEERVYRRNLEELLEVLDGKELTKIQVRRLSLGERMKMELIASLLHNPQVVFLDEPTIGLDLISQKKIREFIRYYNQEYQATILLTSHYMQDIESLCRRSIIINHGEVVYDGDLDQVSEIMGNHKLVKLQFSRQVEDSCLSAYGVVKKSDGYHAVLEIEKNQVSQMAKEILEVLPVVDFNVEDVPIEDGIAYLYSQRAGGRDEN